MKNKNNKFNINRDELYSATSLVNYIRSDCIVDLLDIINKNNYEIDIEDNFNIKKRKFDETNICETNKTKDLSNIDNQTQNKRKRTSSFDYIVEDGYIFEKNIIKEIKNKMSNSNELSKLIELVDKDITLLYLKTLKTLKEKKHDIILGAILVNELNKTYGFPDLIVSGHWIKKYIKDSCDVININKYYIIDIKSSSINLIQSGENVASSLLYDGYKAQIYVYTQALNYMLKTDITIGFIMGKNYQFNLNGCKIRIEDPFDKLGQIDYINEENQGRNFNIKILEAIKWKNNLKENFQTYSLNPIKNDLLYPNMKNSYDKNHKKIKKDIALANKEITLLWNCGIKNRELAWDKGIKNYGDKNLTPEILGFNTKSSRYNILDLMLKTNQNLTDTTDYTNIENLIVFDKSSNINNWKQKKSYEFYVDFETYLKGKIYGENIDEDFHNELNSQVVYMIGVNYIINSKCEFKCFILQFIPDNIKKNIDKRIKNRPNTKCSPNTYVYCKTEEELINKFVDFINLFNPKQKLENYYNNIRLIHWSQAEPILFNKKIIEYGLVNKKYYLPWYDLLKIFKNDSNPIIIKNCFGFGLKEIVKKLNEYKQIEICWPELDDGLLSSFIAREIYSDTNIDKSIDNYINKIDDIINIVEYNHIDCLALYKILEWMRKY